MATTKRFTRKELESRTSAKDAVFVIDNVVYDVTPFLDEHPGGHEVLLEKAGGDATENFEDIGHSADAKELMKKYAVGEVVDEDRVVTERRQFAWDESGKTQAGGGWGTVFLPVVLGLAATIIYKYLFE